MRRITATSPGNQGRKRALAQRKEKEKDDHPDTQPYIAS
jgi:hypothetical protein